MKALGDYPKLATVLGVLLALLFSTMLMHFLFNVPPNLGPLEPALRSENSRLGSNIVLDMLLLLQVGFALNLVPLVRCLRSGGSLTSLPYNLLAATAILIVTLAFAAAILVDQYPCWIGVPYCD
jgi:hypothetical protein